MLTKEQAEGLWESLRGAFQRADEVIVEIIATKAWEPLGYPDFSAAWKARMKGIRLAAEIRSHVVYAMLEDSDDVRAVRDALGMGSGMGIDTIENYARERANGVEAGSARGRRPSKPVLRRATTAEMPSAPYRITVDFDEATRLKYAELAERVGTSLEIEARRAIETHFSRLEERLRKEAC